MDQSIFSLFTTKDWPFQLSSSKLTTAADAQTRSDQHPTRSDTRTRSKNVISSVPTLRTREETIDGLLFFDRLMRLGSIPNFQELFPPPHPSRLRQLLDSIDACSFDLLKKNCLVYYLLKEYGDGRETRFAIDRLMPSHFSRGLDGLWALDHSQWQAAIRLMSDPTVTPDFLPEIIQTLATQPPLKLRSTYLMRFYQLTQPSLDLPSIKLVLRAMCTNSHLRSAWALQRSYGQSDRDRLLRLIFETCFGLNDHRQPLPKALQILLGFPFDELEDSVLSRFAISSPKLLPEPQSMVVIQFYLSKLTSEARYIEAIRFERELAQSARLGSNPDIDRVIRGIADMLPEVQRNMLELEFDQQHPILNPTHTSSGTIPNASDGMDLGASYDVCSLAWDPPASPPNLPPPASLAEARTQQEILNPPKTPIASNSLPLSASPILRRTIPRMSLDKSNESQKTLLKALAYTRQPSAPNSPVPNPTFTHMDEVVADSNEPTNLASQTSSRPTPRFTHFVGPSSRLPASTTKPPPPPPQPNFSTSFSRSSVAAIGSPFHRLSFPDAADKPSSSSSSAAVAAPTTTTNTTGEDRWPTRIVFTPRRPSSSQRKFEEKMIPKPINPTTRNPILSNNNNNNNNSNNRRQVRDKAVDSSGSSDSGNENDDRQPIASGRQAPPAVGKQQFAAVVVPREPYRRQTIKSPPKKIARVNSKTYPTRRTPRTVEPQKVLPGGFAMDDDDDDGYDGGGGGGSGGDEMMMEEPSPMAKHDLKNRKTNLTAIEVGRPTSNNENLNDKPGRSNHNRTIGTNTNQPPAPTLGRRKGTRAEQQSTRGSSTTMSTINSNPQTLPPLPPPMTTPRRSTRLHSTTPAKKTPMLPGGMIDHNDDSIDEDHDDDHLPSTHRQHLSIEKENDHMVKFNNNLHPDHISTTTTTSTKKSSTQSRSKPRKKVQKSIS